MDMGQIFGLTSGFCMICKKMVFYILGLHFIFIKFFLRAKNFHFLGFSRFFRIYFKVVG